MEWFAQAPANIALIKYMGKKDAHLNIPANASLSYTLEHLRSSVKLQTLPGKKDVWEPLVVPGALAFSLSSAGQVRFINHLQRIKEHFGYEGAFLLESSNNFPHGTGLASSASSFAALTKCACLALSELTQKPMPSLQEQAALSRLGSGSSCRSFFSPWALWTEDEVGALKLSYERLLHQVVIVSAKEKKTTSSAAHELVTTSPLYALRQEQVKKHISTLLQAFEAKDWPSIYQICWREFQDMHRLFETSAQPFSYMNEASLQVLGWVEALWAQQGDGPVVTMDAGPNVHLLYREEQADLARHFKMDYLLGNYDVL